MTALTPTLRKAAVLISALDEAAAEALLDQMGAEQAAKVRSSLVALDDISAAEQQQVLAEFLGAQGASAALGASRHDDVSLEIDPALEAAAALAPPLPARLPNCRDEQRAESTWDFLLDVDPERVARLLRQEPPQVIAAVVGQLPAEHAGSLLENLPADLATEVLERMADLHELSPEVVADLAKELRQKLMPQGRASASTSFGHLTAVLAAMDFRQRQRVILQLSHRNASLLGRLGLSTPAQGMGNQTGRQVAAFRYRLERSHGAGPGLPVQRQAAEHGGQTSLIHFDDFVQLSDAAIRAVFAAAHPDIVLLALTAADERLTERILRQLPVRERAVLQSRLQQPGPLRLREIERAERELAEIASRLAHAGAIDLPSTIRFAAAV